MNSRERGIYATLKAHCWRDKCLPRDIESLSRLANEDPRDFEVAWPMVQKPFVERNGFYIHPGLERERKKQREFSRKQRANALKRYYSKTVKLKNATAMPRHNSGNARAGYALQSLSSSSTTVNNNTPLPPLNDAEKRLLDYLQTTPPLNRVVDQETFVRRLAGVYGAERVLGEFRAVVAYCAARPEWEAGKKNWNKTLAGWVKRSAEAQAKKTAVASITQGIKEI